MKYRISDLLDHLRDDTVGIETLDAVSPERVKALTGQKLHRTPRGKTHLHLARRLILAAVVVVLLAGSALAIAGENGSKFVISVILPATTETQETQVYFYEACLDDEDILGLQFIGAELDTSIRIERWRTSEGEICLQQYGDTLLTDAPRDPDWFDFDYADTETGRLTNGHLMLCTDYYREDPEGDILAGRLWRWINHDTSILLSADAGVTPETLDAFVRGLKTFQVFSKTVYTITIPAG